MPIYKGNKEITAIYKGDKPISAIYKGDTLIFSSEKGKPLSKTYPTKGQAQKRLNEIDYFANKKK